jgi:hypothetical protein
LNEQFDDDSSLQLAKAASKVPFFIKFDEQYKIPGIGTLEVRAFTGVLQ